jgi:hypothetical protein
MTTFCSLVRGYRRFGGTYILHIQDTNGGSMFLLTGVRAVTTPNSHYLTWGTILKFARREWAKSQKSPIGQPVGRATKSRVRFSIMARDFSLLHNGQTILEPTQPASRWGFQEVKRPRPESVHSLPSRSMSRSLELHIRSPIRLYGVVLN